MSKDVLMLVADDDENDVFFLKRCLEKESIGDRIEIVRTGAAAIEYLQGTGAYAERESYPLPKCVLLDLRLPLRSGLEVLRWIRSHEPTRRIPVFLNTTADLRLEGNEAIQLGISGVIAKTTDMDKYCVGLRNACELVRKFTPGRW